MADRQAAEVLAAQLREWAAEIEPSTPEADATMRVYLDAADLIDALSVRLAQAEQERDTLRERLMVAMTEDEYFQEREQLLARLREYEEARCRCGAAMDEVHVTRTGVCPTHGVQPVSTVSDLRWTAGDTIGSGRVPPRECVAAARRALDKTYGLGQGSLAVPLLVEAVDWLRRALEQMAEDVGGREAPDTKEPT